MGPANRGHPPIERPLCSRVGCDSTGADFYNRQRRREIGGTAATVRAATHGSRYEERDEVAPLFDRSYLKTLGLATVRKRVYPKFLPHSAAPWPNRLLSRGPDHDTPPHTPQTRGSIEAA